MSENQFSPRNSLSNLPDLTDEPQTAPQCDWCKEWKLSEWCIDPFIELAFGIDEISRFFCDDCWYEREHEGLDAQAQS